MKIKSFTIRGLYGYIDYNIEFNDDVTFLYGENGSGKTTILNMLTSIITGRIYELYVYNFESIELRYATSKSTPSCRIYLFKDNEIIHLTYKNQKYRFLKSSRHYLRQIVDDELNHFRHIEEDEFNSQRTITENRHIIDEIQKEFNYVYLPLNRKGNLTFGNRFFNHERNRRRVYNNPEINNPEASFYTDETLYDVAFFAKEKYSMINLSLNRINERFSQDILKSLLDIEYISNGEQMQHYMKELNTLTLNKVKEIKEKYLKALKSIEMIDQKDEERINTFFDSLLEDMDRVNNEEGPSLSILFKLSELTKIMKIVSKAEKIEQQKNKVLLPINKFLDTVNYFIESATFKKEVYFGKNGDLLFKTPHDKSITLDQLSSGEKQIVTFFAYLIFVLQDTKQSIFIVDEPELSLHLKWQRVFVDTLLELNPDIQLIFATHAPELIGKHSNKAKKLNPIIRK